MKAPPDEWPPDPPKPKAEPAARSLLVDVLWLFAPAILTTISPMAGASGREFVTPTTTVGLTLLAIGTYGSPVILLPLAARFARQGRSSGLFYFLKVIVLTILMCATNLVIGAVGCTTIGFSVGRVVRPSLPKPPAVRRFP